MKGYNLDRAREDGISTKFCIEYGLLCNQISNIRFYSERDRKLVYDTLNRLESGSGFHAIPFCENLHSFRNETPPSGINLIVIHMNAEIEPIKMDTSEAYFDQESNEWYYAHSERTIIGKNSVIAWAHKA